MKLYTALNETGQLMKQFRIDNKIEEILTVGDSVSLGLKPNTLNKELFKEQLDTIVPDVNYTGNMFLDIEDAYGDDLLNLPADNEDFQKSLAHFIDVIRYAKELRPLAKWGYYGIPFTTYWDRIPEFFSKEEKISSLIDECDILYPSLYNFYKDDVQSNMPEENKRYAEELSIEMIKLKVKYNKPVIIFVWNRYHPSTISNLERLLDDVFLTHLQRIKESTYEGAKIDGIVWWSADDYFYQQGEDALLKEFTGTLDEFKIFNDTVLYNLTVKIQNFL